MQAAESTLATQTVLAQWVQRQVEQVLRSLCDMSAHMAVEIAVSIIFLPQYVLVVLAVDILDTYSQINNVADDVQWYLIMSRIRTKGFSFLLVAPPCSTFSEARGADDQIPAARHTRLGLRKRFLGNAWCECK